jgi:NodT family efflux transporter outer membrane factor (OMF) lipoprotein
MAAMSAPFARFAITIALAVQALAGCALKDPPSVGALQRDALPNLAVPARWQAAEAPAASLEDGWLARFDDSALSTLVDEALAYNTDLAAAVARVEQAAASVRIAGGALVPAVDAYARGGSKLGGDLSGLTGGGVNVSWELDIWGRVRYGARAAEDTYASAQADLAFARQSIAGLVSKSWFLATEATQQLALASETVVAAERLVSLATDRQRVGVGTEVDVALASANLNAFRDTTRGLEAARLQSFRALETLLGRYPSASVAVPAAWRPLPAASAAGMPSDLLERRPDVIAAERRVAAAWNLVGEARAARLPRLSLVAGVSAIDSDLFVLQSFDNPAVSVGANLLWPIFRGGALEGVQELRTAQQKLAIAAWASTGLRAFGEVENALDNEASLAERERILLAAVADAQRALELQQVRYKVGSGDLRSVAQQQIAVYATRMSLLRVQSEMRVQRVNLHLALGGDFAPAQPVAR